MENFNTPSGIEPATFRLVAQNLKQLRHCVLFKKKIVREFSYRRKKFWRDLIVKVIQFSHKVPGVLDQFEPNLY
jgi:hypothetical protein